MNVQYLAINNCYDVTVKIPIAETFTEIHAVIDTGASNTTISLDMLVHESPSDNIIGRLDKCAQELGIQARPLRGATVARNIEEAYTYAACFKNVVVGGHFIERFHMNIMLRGAENICVIGNDFLNMCNYQHKAGEKCLVIENPNIQKYHDSFGKTHVLEGKQLNMLLSGSEDKAEVKEDLMY